MDNTRHIRLRGRVVDALRDTSARVTQHTPPLDLDPIPTQMGLIEPAERSVVALACIVLEELRAAGGTRAPEGPLREVLDKLTRSLGPEDFKTLEIEAYEIFAWIGDALLGPEPDPVAPERISEHTSHEAIIRWSVLQGRDLRMTFYDAASGEIRTHVVSPLRLEAEAYLVAFSHDLGDRHVYRLSRVASLEPEEGWEAYRLESMPSPHVPPRGSSGPQMSMFEEEEE